MALSIMKMGPVLFGSRDNLIAYLQGKGLLLATNKQCPNCPSTMVLQVLQRGSDIEDKYRYHVITYLANNKIINVA